MALYYLEEKSLRDLDRTSFISEGIKERSDLQRYLLNRIDIISPDLFVITEEFSEWESSMRRIDILCIDKNANLVVIEIKRDSDGSHMELQSVRYASMISSLKFDTLVDIYKQYLVKNRKESDAEKALDSILNFLGWDSPQEDNFANDTRVILVAEDFSKEITTFVNVGFRMDYIKIMIKMGDEKIVDSKGVCSEIPKSFGYGRMTKMFDVKSLDDVDYAISLIKQAYDIN